jgi:hypothetical protein
MHVSLGIVGDSRKIQVEQGQDGGHSVNVWVAADSSSLFVVHPTNGPWVGEFQDGSGFRMRGTDRDPWLFICSLGPSRIDAVRGDYPGTGTEFTLEKVESNDENVQLLHPVRIKGPSGDYWVVNGSRICCNGSAAAATWFLFEKVQLVPGLQKFCIELLGSSNQVVYKRDIHVRFQAEARSQARLIMRQYNLSAISVYRATAYSADPC